jgi:putative ABC transport system permease protein
MLNDVRLAIRSLARSPGFTLIAVLTVALGIGASTAIFSVVHGVVLRPLPFPDPSRLVALYETLPARPDAPARDDMPLAPPTTRDWEANRSFTSLAAYSDSTFILTGEGEPIRVAGAEVSWTFFETLRATPSLGRLLTRDDDGPSAPLVAIVSHRLWRTRFGSDPSLVGRTVELSGKRHTVVGVAHEGFAFPDASDVWTPLALPPDEYADNQRQSFYLSAIARLRPGVSHVQASDDLNGLVRSLSAKFPAIYAGRGANVVPLRTALVGDVSSTLYLLLGAVGLVLLIACANVANLLLARATGREAEIAIRVALGASRVRIVRQLVAESLVLSFAGAACGALLAMWARDAIVAISPAGVPRIAEVRVGIPALAFAALLAVATGVLFGVVPGLFLARRGPGESLKGGRTATGSPAKRRFSSALVVAELALSLALLTGAGLLGRTLWKLAVVNPGFEADGVMTMELTLPPAKYREPAQRAAFFNRVVEQLRTNPLIESAGGSTNLPLSNTNMSFGFYREAMTPGQDAPLFANVRAVTAGYLPTLRVPLLAGRELTDADRQGAVPVVVVNETFRRKFWPSADPLGQRIALTRGRTPIWREIVGVVGDMRHAALRSEPTPEIYVPVAQEPFPFMRVAVRSSADSDVTAGVMRAAVWAVDRDQPVARVRPLRDIVSASVADTRFNAVLIGAFAAMSILLAAVGLYGLVAHAVTLRLQEFGIRVALGAERRHVAALVLRQALGLAGCGLAAGYGLALLLTRLVAAQLYQTPRTDPFTMAAVAVTLLVIALVASYAPARRALNVDPIVALRAQ